MTSAPIAISGGDSRNALDPETQLNKYGCSPWPTETVAFGSCTSSSPSRHAFAAAEVASAAVPEIERSGGTSAAIDALRDRLMRILLLHDESCDLIFCPSGTDAEYLAIAVAQSWDPTGVLCNIVTAPLEVGGGTMPAAGGLYFDECTPNELTNGLGADGGDSSGTGFVVEAWKDNLVTRQIAIRGDDGGALDPDFIDGVATRETEEALGRGESVLLHIVAHSKTGVHAPSFECARKLQNDNPGKVHVVVDAAQGRFSRRGLGQSLHENDIVIFTGSKFYGGLPFAGALLVPRVHSARLATTVLPAELSAFFSRCEFPERLRDAAANLHPNWNPGLYVRWSSALAEMERYYAALDERRLAILRRFEAAAPQWVSASPWMVSEPILEPVEADDVYRLLESKTTVFCFGVRRHLLDESAQESDDDFYDLGELREIFRWMYTDLRSHEGLCQMAIERGQSTEILRGFHIGQPVPLSHSYAALRFAIGAPMISEIAEIADEREFSDRLMQLEFDVCDAVSKLELLASEFATLTAENL